MVLTTAVRVHDRIVGDQAAPVGYCNRFDGDARAHVRRDRVPDQFLAAQVKYGREIQPVPLENTIPV